MAEASIIGQLAQQFGAAGLIIGYRVWIRLQVRADRVAGRPTGTNR